MIPLSQQKCTACNSQSTGVTKPEATHLLALLAGWILVDRDGVTQLCKTYQTTDFVSALALTQQVGILAEQYDHHPAILLEWGRVEIRWWTHAIEGVHKNDFILAAKTDNVIV